MKKIDFKILNPHRLSFFPAIIYLIFIMLVASCRKSNDIARESIDLNGIWQFNIDPDDSGIQQKWYLTDLKDSILLPGTTDLNKKGFMNTDTTTMHLTRLYKYEGAAWYRKKLVIPESFRERHIQLFLERTRFTQIWIDSVSAGYSRLLQSPQMFDVSDYLTPGDHYITIRVDNSLKNFPYGNVHIYSDDTQTNWNGIIGRMFIEASAKTYISGIQVYPDVDNRKIRIGLEIANGLNLENATFKIKVRKTLNGKTESLKSEKVLKSVEPETELEYSLGRNCSFWDEYHQPVYSLTVEISDARMTDLKTVTFGMRKFEAKGTQFAINGRTVFLRGKHEAAVFPLTGFPPMDAEGWIRVFKIAKSYGINHYRFHSYCPAEAAFEAADKVGIYIQAELPFWGGLDSDHVAGMLREEGINMLKAYANHPSFVMFSHGNEIWSGYDLVENNLDTFRMYDDRLLYTMGSNNGLGFAPPRTCSDFFVAARTPYPHDTILTHTRLTFAFADSYDGGMLNTQIPSTERSYSYPVSTLNIPVISHEAGQYQVYPDFKEIEKYTGVLQARNLEIFRNRLREAGMLDQDIDFQKASGAWAARCYKAEMETAVRTKGLAGIQLLDLQDFPGQGTALVGMLDAFMKSKNVVTQEEWLHSCNDVELLLEFPKYCWTTGESFHAKAEVANYSDRSFNERLQWEIKDQSGNVLQSAIFSDLTIENGGIKNIGEIDFNFAEIKKAEKLTINISLENTPYSNSYPLWVYPVSAGEQENNNITVASGLNSEVLSRLTHGGKVLLLPADVAPNKSLPGLFTPDFWNFGMFKGISERAGKPVSPGTLGILTDPDHPLFNSFPTDFHTDWQWFSIIKAGNPLILDKTPAGYRPIVQVIDNLERNHKLGLIFEFKVDTGKLLICMSQLNKISDKPEALQLYKSIIKYMESGDFDPAYELTHEELASLL